MEEVENSKSEARSTKQYAMTKIQMTKTMDAIFLFGTF
jgi:hypothetical protein